MYRLEVHHVGNPRPTAVRSAQSAGEALELIPSLLEGHPDCDRVNVWFDLTRLFAVDCKGNRVSG
jgi:hypothetical protein